MNTEIVFRCFLDFVSVYPAAVLCFAPVYKHIRSLGKTIAAAAIVLTLFCAVSSVICAVFDLDCNILMLPEMAILFLLFYLSVKKKISFAKSLYVFLNAALMASACALTSVIVNAGAELGNTNNVCTISTSLICLSMEALIGVIYLLSASKWLRWLIDNFNSERVWNTVWIFPASFTALYVFVMPKDPAVVLINRTQLISVSAIMLSLPVFFLFIYLLYRTANEFLRNIQLTQQNQLLAAESHRYEELRSYLEKSRRQRHDFKQHIRVIYSLAADKKQDELCRYLRQYESELGDETPSLCENNAIDALAGHYDNSAKRQDIAIEWHLNIPKDIPMPESDLCVALGNLLENAVRECARMPEGNRRISVICKMLSTAMIGLIVENTYNEALQPSKKNGGIGLISVESIARKYNGTTAIEKENGIFRVNLLLNL